MNDLVAWSFFYQILPTLIFTNMFSYYLNIHIQNEKKAIQKPDTSENIWPWDKIYFIISYISFSELQIEILHFVYLLLEIQVYKWCLSQ